MTLKKGYVLGALGAAAAIYLAANALYNLFICEEQKVKSLFSAMKSDIENRDVLDFASYFTADALVRCYDAEIPARQLPAFILAALRNRADIRISFSEFAAEIGAGAAAVTFAGDVTDLAQGSQGSFEGTAKLRKVDGDWKVYDACGRERKKPAMIY